MKKKMTLKKAAMAVGVVTMSVGLFNSFNLDAQSGSCVSGPVGDDAYMLCDYKKVWFSTNCKVKPDYTCLLRDTGPGFPDLP